MDGRCDAGTARALETSPASEETGVADKTLASSVVTPADGRCDGGATRGLERSLASEETGVADTTLASMTMLELTLALPASLGAKTSCSDDLLALVSAADLFAAGITMADVFPVCIALANVYLPGWDVPALVTSLPTGFGPGCAPLGIEDM